jgi:hypothetical protein
MREVTARLVVGHGAWSGAGLVGCRSSADQQTSENAHFYELNPIRHVLICKFLDLFHSQQSRFSHCLRHGTDDSKHPRISVDLFRLMF